MNISKVRNSAEFVNYVKPELEMVEMETENSLLLTASIEPTSAKVGISTPGGFQEQTKKTATIVRR